MSRVGKSPISLPDGVSFTLSGNELTVKGKLGILTQKLEHIQVKEEGGVITLERPSESKEHKALHGLYRSLIYNMVVGVSEGFTKEFELIGVGYRAIADGQVLELGLGHSHSIVFEICPEVKVEANTEKGKPPVIKLSSYDKQLLGHVAAKIRSFRKPEPYKGKGIRFVGEQVRKKAGKSA